VRICTIASTSSPISLPLLKERPGGHSLLATHFLKKYADEMGKTVKGFTPEAMKRLMRHSWPGNVRELENVVERSVVMIDEETVRPAASHPSDEKERGDATRPRPGDQRGTQRDQKASEGEGC